MIESLRTTQIAFFRFATPSGFLGGGAETRYKKHPCKGPCKEKSYETICENIVSRYQTLVSSLPREAVFLHRQPKPEFITGLHRQPSKKPGPWFTTCCTVWIKTWVIRGIYAPLLLHDIRSPVKSNWTLVHKVVKIYRRLNGGGGKAQFCCPS